MAEGGWRKAMPRIRFLIFAFLGATALATSAGAQNAHPQAIEGKFRGGYVCGKLPTTRDILHVPIDLEIHDGNVRFARPLFNMQGAVVVGSELGQGTVESDGTSVFRRLRQASRCSRRGPKWRAAAPVRSPWCRPRTNDRRRDKRPVAAPWLKLFTPRSQERRRPPEMSVVI
ncbi:MAG: hypothetical protein WA776_16315 [Xanthobacteraceae bacterium]